MTVEGYYNVLIINTLNIFILDLYVVKLYTLMPINYCWAGCMTWQWSINASIVNIIIFIIIPTECSTFFNYQFNNVFPHNKLSKRIWAQLIIGIYLLVNTADDWHLPALGCTWWLTFIVSCVQPMIGIYYPIMCAVDDLVFTFSCAQLMNGIYLLLCFSWW